MDESDKADDNDNDYEDDDESSDSEEDLVLNDLDKSAESGDSEIEENKDQPEPFDQVILRSGRLATIWQSHFLARTRTIKPYSLELTKCSLISSNPSFFLCGYSITPPAALSKNP